MKSKTNINDSALFQILACHEKITYISTSFHVYITTTYTHIFVRKYMTVYNLIDITVVDKHIQHVQGL